MVHPNRVDLRHIYVYTAHLKTFTSTFSNPAILSSSFSIDPMRFRASCTGTQLL